MKNSNRMIALLEQMAALIKEDQQEQVTEAPARASSPPPAEMTWRTNYAIRGLDPVTVCAPAPALSMPTLQAPELPPPQTDPDLATYRQVAEEYGVSYSHAASWAKKCPAAAVKGEGHMLLRRSTIRAWREEQRDPPSKKKGPTKSTPRDLDRLAARTADIVSQIRGGGLQRDGHEQWQTPRDEEPIIVYGEEIWPTHDARYDWRAAYYAFNIWRTIDKALHQTSPTDRGHLFRNPLGPMVCHLNGPAGIVLQKIGNAMIDRPHAASETRGPGKILQGR